MPFMTLSRIQQFELQQQREIALNRVHAILRESPPVLREKLAWITSTLADDWHRSIEIRYQIAVVIRDIFDDVTENNGSVYGAKAVQAIKDTFGWDDGVIYRAINVANAFTPEKIEEITQMRLPGGNPLTYSHVVELSRVEDDGQREKFFKQTVKEGWTTRKLANVVAPVREVVNAVGPLAAPQHGNQEDRRGRPLAKPRNFDAVLDQQASFIKDFLNRDEHVWSHQDHKLPEHSS
jgi:hypothetical protein